MADISSLEGINSGEVVKLCRANIGTVEAFLEQFKHGFAYGIMYMSTKTGIKDDRLVEFVPLEHLPVETLPDVWVEGVTARVLREAEPDDPWLRRCRYRLGRVARGMKGNWLGWKKNLPIVALVAVVLLFLALTLRAAGGLQRLPSPLGLREQALIAAEDMESGRVLKPADLYPALLPQESDYFGPGASLGGLVLARPVVGQKPLRFGDVSRRQVTAARDIQDGSVIHKEDVELAWGPYRPGAALATEEVVGRRISAPVPKGAAILTELLGPAK